MNRKRLIRALLWAAVIGLMAVIFAFSAQHGSQSNALSDVAAMPLTEMFASLQDGADEQTVTYLYVLIGTIIRKAAHLCEYGLLGLLLALLCRSYGLTADWLPVVIGTVYAATDELHQAFVPQRLGSVTDVLIDALGVLGGVCLTHMILKIRRKKHVHDQ